MPDLSRPTHFFKRHQPFTRHLAHLLFWAFLVLAAAFRANVIDLDHDTEWFLGYLSLLSAAGLLGPWLIYRFVPWFEEKGSERLLGAFEVMIAVAMIASWIGAFGMYRVGLGYDTGVHVFVSSLIALMVVMAALSTRFELGARMAAILGCAALVTILAGSVNEVFEWGGDQLFGTSMYGEAGEPNDTFKDAIGNMAGFVIGSSFAYANRKRLMKFISTT